MKGKFIAGCAVRAAALASIGIASVIGGAVASAAETGPQGLPLDVKPLQVSPEMQKKLDKDYGTSELIRLEHDLESSLRYARKKTDPAACVNGAVTLETTLVDASPNHPTMEQMRRQTGLDYLRSISIGGAELKGELKAADGHIITTIPYKRYAMDLRQASFSADTWGDARQSFDGYARAIAKSCRGGK
jgi:hypothetical protein